MEQVQKSHSGKAKEKQQEAVSDSKEVAPEIEAHKLHSDELLDEIDSLLEENAQEFVENFIQKGGE